MFKKFLSLLLCLIMVLSLAACKVSVQNGSVETPPVTEENTEHEDLSSPDAPDYRDDTIGDDMGGITTCMVGETIELEDCNITLVGYEVFEGDEWYTPDNDCFVGVNFIIENTSSNIFSIATELSFTGYADNFYADSSSTWLMANYFGENIDVDLAPQKSVNGWIVYDINSDWEKLEVDFVYSKENIIEARFLIENEG